MDDLTTSVTAKYSDMPMQHSAGRPFENVVVNKLSGKDTEEYEAVEEAIRETTEMENGDVRMSIINLVYWKQSHTLAGAGMQAGYSYRHTQRVNEQFAYLVAENLGLKEKMASQSHKGKVL